MIHLKWIKSRKVRNIKNSLPLIIIKVDITYITSHNVYYVNFIKINLVFNSLLLSLLFAKNLYIITLYGELFIIIIKYAL